jgi:hypothetical protein
MHRIFALCFFICVARMASADWHVVRVADDPSAVVTLVRRHVDLEHSGTGERAMVDLAIFYAKSCRLRVIDNADGASSLASALRLTNCLAGVNGGYFDDAFAPVGLLIVDGKTLSPIRRARLLTGILAASPRGVQIFRVREFSAKQKLDAAVECGPMIVDLGKPVRGLESTRPARRTFAAIAGGDRSALGVCSAVTLDDLANILVTDLAADFKIQRALNLDGGSSSAFWFKRQNGSAFSISEEKTVRDFVVVAPR